MRFDWTISIGNVITCFSFLVLAIAAWKDLTWRITNLEIWRKEHMIDSDSRDSIIHKLDKVIERWDQREKDRAELERRKGLR